MGFNLFGPWYEDPNVVMRSIGNVVSLWAAGAFISAVFASTSKKEYIVKFQRWMKWYSTPPITLLPLRIFLRGPCFWLGRNDPPECRRGNEKWIVQWGYAFFLVKAFRSELSVDFKLKQ